MDADKQQLCLFVPLNIITINVEEIRFGSASRNQRAFQVCDQF